MLKKILLLSFLLFPMLCSAQDFFVMGSGELYLKNQKNGASVKVRYRDKEVYEEAALRKIHAVYGANYDDINQRMPLRFIEVLSNVQTHFQGAPLLIRSGYRSPKLNQSLRDQGKLAGQSSMHLEASAADFFIPGIDTTTLRDYAQGLDCCGVGYYHGVHIHLDTGPKRWWDEKTSGTESKEPQENEKIIIITEKDIYKPADKIFFDFARITNYPVLYDSGILLENKKGEDWVSASSKKVVETKMVSLTKPQDKKKIEFQAEKNLKPGRYRLKVLLDTKQWAKMPPSIYSNEFEVRE